LNGKLIFLSVSKKHFSKTKIPEPGIYLFLILILINLAKSFDKDTLPLVKRLSKNGVDVY
jgi:hypothetical protein